MEKVLSGKPVKWKTIIMLAITILVLLRIAYICVGGKLDKRYYISAPIDVTEASEIPCQNIVEKFSVSQERLHSLEVIFDGIAEDKTGSIEVKIMLREELVYQAKLSLENINNLEWKQVYVNAELIPGKEYEIHLNASDDCIQMPNVLIISEDIAAPEVISSWSEKIQWEGEVAVRYGYMQFPGRLDRAVVSSLWLIFLLLTMIFLCYFELIGKYIRKVTEYVFTIMNREVFYVVAEIFGSLIIINCSGIEFQPFTQILFYFISICAGIKFADKKEYVNRICNTAVKKGLLYVLYVYAAFSLVGQRILIYPLTSKVTAAGICVFAVALLWFVPVIQTFFGLYDKLCISFSDKHSCKDMTFVLIAFLLLLLPSSYNLFANNPGISSPDTLATMIYNAHHLRGMTDWHPAFYCMVLRVILTIWDSTYAVIIAQYFFWAYVMLELLLYLREKGIKDFILFSVTLFSGMNAANILHLNTIWKDIPYTLSILWTLIILAKLTIDFDEYKTKQYIYAELVIALVGVFFYRKNGIASFIIIVVMMAVFLRKNIKMWCALALTLVCIFVVKGPIYSYFEIKDPGRGGMYIGLGQDILGVYYGGGDVSDKTLQMINVMTDYNNAEYVYMPTWSSQSKNLNVEPLEFIINYLDTFVNNPVLMIRAVMAREDAVWDIFVGQDAIVGNINRYGTVDGQGEWNEYYPARIYRSLYTWMSAATAYTANTQWIGAIEWRCGLFTLLAIVTFIFAVMKEGQRIKEYGLLTAPIIGHILSLLLSTGWSEFRYFWPLNLMNMSIILFIMVIMIDQNKKTEEE